MQRHGLGGLSGLINGLIAAAIGAYSMLMSEPTAKSNVKRTRMFVLSIATLHCIDEPLSRITTSNQFQLRQTPARLTSTSSPSERRIWATRRGAPLVTSPKWTSCLEMAI